MIQRLIEIFKEKEFQKKWRKIFFTFASVVTFVTVYALILPAITVEVKEAIQEQLIPGEEPIEQTEEVVEEPRNIEFPSEDSEVFGEITLKDSLVPADSQVKRWASKS